MKSHKCIITMYVHVMFVHAKHSWYILFCLVIRMVLQLDAATSGSNMSFFVP